MDSLTEVVGLTTKAGGFSDAVRRSPAEVSRHGK